MTNASPVRALRARICSDKRCRGSNASRVIATVTPGAGSGVSVILRMLGLSWGSWSTGRTHRYRLILPGATVIDSGCRRPLVHCEQQWVMDEPFDPRTEPLHG